MRVAALRLLSLGLLLGSAQATDVRLQVSDPALVAAVQQALQALSTGGSSYTLVNAPDVVFALGGAPFSPDVASRSFAGPPPRVEFNPAGPLPLADAVQAELRRLLKLPVQTALPAAGTSATGTSSTATSSNSASGTSGAGTPAGGASSAGTSVAGASTAGSSAAGTSSVGTSTGGVSVPAVKAGPADLNGDGVIDPGDLAIFMANLGKSGKGLPGDLNGDGRVDDGDLQQFVKLYKLP